MDAQTLLLGDAVTVSAPAAEHRFLWRWPWLRPDNRVYVKEYEDGKPQWYICAKTCERAVRYFDKLNAAPILVQCLDEMDLRKIVARCADGRTV